MPELECLGGPWDGRRVALPDDRAATAELSAYSGGFEVPETASVDGGPLQFTLMVHRYELDALRACWRYVGLRSVL